MGGVTDWVRRALAELGSDATVKEVTDYILGKDSTVPKGHISLAMRNLKLRGLAVDKPRSPTKRPYEGLSQGTLDFEKS